MQHARVREFKSKKQQKVEEESTSSEESTDSSEDWSSSEEEQKRKPNKQQREESRSIDHIKFYSSEVPVEKKAKKEINYVEYTNTETKAMQRKEYKKLKNKKP